MGKISDLIGPIGGQTKNTQTSSGGKIATLLSTVKNNPTVSVTQNQPKKISTSSPSLISSAPQIISGIAKGISIGKLIITAATRQATQPQIDVSKVALPTPQPQATPQKTISITPNQKILTPQQLKVVAPQPVAGQSATMKTAKPGSPSVVSRAAAVMPQTTAQVKDTAATVNEFIKSPSQFKSKATYDANNSTGLIEDIATRKITDFLHLPREAPAMIKAAIEAVAGPVGQGIALAMQERLSPPKTAGELVGLKAKQITNAITIGLTPINALFAAADKTPYVSELMRAVTIPFLAAGEVSTKASDKIIDALPISQQAKNSIKGPIGELAALTAQIALGHSLAKISGKAMGKLDDASKAAFTTLTKDIIETNGGKGTASFTPADVRKVAIFNEGGKYHKALVDILAQEGKNAGDLWTKAVKEGITIELPFEKVIGMVDKPWWGKIKKFLNAGATDTTTTTQVPGRIVGPATEGAAPASSIEKQIIALLPENINHNPQAVINAVIKGGLDKTPEGKGLIKAALEAQQTGKDLTISTSKGRDITPEDKVIMEQIKTLEPIAKADMQKAQAEADMRSAATEDLGLRPKDRQDFARLGALIKNAEDKGMIDVQSLKKTSSTLLNWGLERWREIKPQAVQMGDDEILREIQDFTSQNQLSKVSRVEKPASVTLLEDLKKSLKGIAKDNPKDIARTLDQAYQEAGVDPQTGRVDKKTEALDYLNKKSSNTVKFRAADQSALDAQAYTDHARTLIERRKNLKLEHPDWLDTNDVLTQNEKAINVALDLAAKARASKPVFRLPDDMNAEALTTKILKDLAGKTSVSKQYILDATNRGELKQTERDITRRVLETMPEGPIDVKEFSNKVRAELLPLKIKSSDIVRTNTKDPYADFIEEGAFTPKYEGVALPEEIRGDVANYRENIYESSIETSAAETHFAYLTKKYYGHTRIEDMADDIIRRIIEVQSDLYQKGNLEKEVPSYLNASDYLSPKDLKEYNRIEKRLTDLTFAENSSSYSEEIKQLKKEREDLQVLSKDKEQFVIGNRRAEVAKLQQYNDPTAHFRMIREEVNKAAQDGKTKLQFPTGETAMKIEGLGSEDLWIARPGQTLGDGTRPSVGPNLNKNNMRVGLVVQNLNQGTDMVITDVLGDGKFKAVDKQTYKRAQDYLQGREIAPGATPDPKMYADSILRNGTEQFDISGAVDKNNPIYKFYEKEVAKYLRSKYGAQLVTDSKGVTWNEVAVRPDMAGPVEAFRVKDDVKSFTGKTITDAQEQEIIDLNKKIFGDDNVKITLQIMANEKALGQYYDSMIQVVDGQADPTDTYLHEAVHKYLDIFSTKEEYAGALVEGQKKYKLEDFAQVEEKIAEDFIKFAKDQSTFAGKIKAFFSDLLRRIKAYFGNKSEIDKLYNDIISGKAATASEVKTAATAEMGKIPTNTDAQTPVGTGELKKSKAYTRVYDMLKEEYREDVTYNVLNLKKDAEAAVDFLEKDPKAAIRISLGLEQPPVGQTETAISMAVSEKAMREGEHALVGRVESSLSLRRTRGGQENASLRGRFGDDSAHKYMRELLNKKMAGLGMYVKDALADVVNRGKSVKQAAMDKIDSEAKKIKEAIKKDRKKIQMAQDIINSLICK